VTLADIAIRRPVFAWMLMAALVVFGGIAFTRLGISQLPDVDFPVITVELTLEGAAPEIMESDVADIVEDVVSTVEGVREISSVCRQGRCSVSVEFQLERSIDLALQDIQTKVAQAARRLPADLDPPIVTKTNPEDQPIMWVGLSGARSPQEISDHARFTIRPKLQTLPGVAEVMMGGYLERNVRIWVDAERLERNGVTVPEVTAALAREHREVPAGRIETASRERNVRSEGEALTLDEVRGVVVRRNEDGSVLRLGALAGIEDGLEDRRRVARANGLPAIGMGVKKQRGANAVAVGRRVKAEVAKIKAALPADMDIGVNFDGTQFIEESTAEVEFELCLAIVLTGIVCLLFLGSLSAAGNVLLAIPTSIVGVFAVFYALGFTLNTFTLLGLSLAVGIVVDDAIMVLENIYRHREMGKGAVQAASDGAREITFAAMAATVAIIAIFLPVAFMTGIMGKFFFQFGVTLSVAVALSLLEALTLTPMRASQMGGAAPRHAAAREGGAAPAARSGAHAANGRETLLGRAVDAAFARLNALYGRALRGALRLPLVTLLACIAVFAGSMRLVGEVGKEFVPPQDQGRVLTRIVMPVGSSIDYTDAVMRRCEEFLMKLPEVQRVFLAVGGFGGGEVNTAILFTTLVPRERRDVTQAQYMQKLRKEFNSYPDTKAFIQDLSLQGFTAQRGFPIEFSIRGPSFEMLAAKQAELVERMRASGLMVDIDTDYLVGMPEVQLVPDRDRAADLGVSMAAIGETVQALVGGIRVGKFKEAGHRYDMRVRLRQDQRLAPADVRRLLVRTAAGDLVTLDQVVSIREVPTLLAINRRGRERSVSVFANMAPGVPQDRALSEVERIAADALPPGYRIVFSGSAETFRESFRSLVFALVLGIVVAYMVLASQFNSYLHPVTILLALPFSVTGAVAAIWLMGYTLNIYSMIGLVLLMGIVKKNSIILVDYTNQRRDEMREKGEADRPKEALLEACPIRLRPILMTSFATISAAVPAATGLGPGGEVRAPMAAAVIGGVLVSTLLTLFVVPAFYLTAENLKARLFGVRAPASAPEARRVPEEAAKTPEGALP
jgi:hydrophobe/amphiphile efflux-1 (HAE1) family protein